jgi:hypothetical protein
MTTTDVTVSHSGKSVPPYLNTAFILTVTTIKSKYNEMGVTFRPNRKYRKFVQNFGQETGE